MILDTNILIAYLNGEAAVTEALFKWKQEGRALFISPISHAEVLSLPTLTPSDVGRARAFLKEFISIPFTEDLAEDAALLRRIYRLTLPDAAIAVSALRNQIPLITRDCQFRKISEISTLTI